MVIYMYLTVMVVKQTVKFYFASFNRNCWDIDHKAQYKKYDLCGLEKEVKVTHIWTQKQAVVLVNQDTKYDDPSFNICKATLNQT